MARKWKPSHAVLTCSHSFASLVSSAVLRKNAYDHESLTPVSNTMELVCVSEEMHASSKPFVHPASAAARLVYTAMPGIKVSSGKFSSISSVAPKTSPARTCSISSLTPRKGNATNAHDSPLNASGNLFGAVGSNAINGGAFASYPGCFLYTVSTRSFSHFVILWHRRLANGSTSTTLHALVMMVCIC